MVHAYNGVAFAYSEMGHAMICGFRPSLIFDNKDLYGKFPTIHDNISYICSDATDKLSDKFSETTSINFLPIRMDIYPLNQQETAIRIYSIIDKYMSVDHEYVIRCLNSIVRSDEITITFATQKDFDGVNNGNNPMPDDKIYKIYSSSIFKHGIHVMKLVQLMSDVERLENIATFVSIISNYENNEDLLYFNNIINGLL